MIFQNQPSRNCLVSMARGYEVVLSELGIQYFVAGDEAIAICPSGTHEDRHPSWSLNLRNGAHHCFSCGFAGNLAHLVQHVLRLNYVQASEWLHAAQWWQANQENVSYAPPYLKVDEWKLARFTFPPEEELAKKNVSPEAASLYGVMWNPETYSWIFPIRNPYSDELWGWQEKSVRDRRFRNYPHGVRKSETFFGINALDDDSTPVIVESPLDCLRLFTAGIRSGLSSFGVHVSDRQLSIVHKLAGCIILALDNDSAGVAETDRICREHPEITVYVFSYEHAPDVKDPGEMTEDLDIFLGVANARSRLRRQHDIHGKSAPVPG